jgi:hypothetical protein
LGLQPLAVPLGPRFFRGGEPPAVSQEEVGQAMASPEEVGADVFATAHEIAHRFFLLRRNVNRCASPKSRPGKNH